MCSMGLDQDIQWDNTQHEWVWRIEGPCIAWASILSLYRNSYSGSVDAFWMLAPHQFGCPSPMFLNTWLLALNMTKIDLSATITGLSSKLHPPTSRQHNTELQHIGAMPHPSGLESQLPKDHPLWLFRGRMGEGLHQIVAALCCVGEGGWVAVWTQPMMVANFRSDFSMSVPKASVQKHGMASKLWGQASKKASTDHCHDYDIRQASKPILCMGPQSFSPTHAVCYPIGNVASRPWLHMVLQAMLIEYWWGVPQPSHVKKKTYIYF